MSFFFEMPQRHSLVIVLSCMITLIIVYYTVKTMALEITKSLIMAPEALGTSAGNSIQPLKTKIRARSLDVRAH